MADAPSKEVIAAATEAARYHLQVNEHLLKPGPDDGLDDTFRNMMHGTGIKPRGEPFFPLERMIARADAGDAKLRKDLESFAIVQLEAGPPLARFIARRFRARRSKGQRARNPFANFHRDQAIAVAVHAALFDEEDNRRPGLELSRSEATRDKKSACSIVSAVLKKMKVELSEKRIADIYRRFKE